MSDYYWGPLYNQRRRDKYKNDLAFRLKERRRAKSDQRKRREKQNGTAGTKSAGKSTTGSDT